MTTVQVDPQTAQPCMAPPRVVEGPVSVLNVFRAADLEDRAGKFDLKQVVFGADPGRPWAAASDTLVLARVSWEHSAAVAVEPFGLSVRAVRTALGVAKTFGPHEARTRFVATSFGAGPARLLVVPPAELDGLGPVEIVSAPVGRWPLKAIEEYAGHLAARQVPTPDRKFPLTSKALLKVTRIIEGLAPERFEAGAVAISQNWGGGKGQCVWAWEFGSAPEFATAAGEVEEPERLPCDLRGWIVAMPIHVE